MHRPTATLMDGDLLQHQNNVLISHLPSRNPELQCMKGSLIATTIREIAVDPIRDREEKASVREKVDNKEISKFLGKNLI